MIIKRKFVPFYSLYQRDPFGRAVFLKAFGIENPDNWENIDEKTKEHIDILFKASISLDTADMSCCLPMTVNFAEEFDKLDSEHPYDNGFTLDDVNRIEIVYKEDDVITLCLINDSYGDSLIVGFTNLNFTHIENPERWGNYGDCVFKQSR